MSFINTRLEEILQQLEDTKNFKLIPKIKKLIKNKPLYKFLQAKYRETGCDFYITAMREISPLYSIKALFFSIKQRKKTITIKDKVTLLNSMISEIAGNQEFVYIMQYSFFDPQGVNYYAGGGERYACDLGKIIKQKGCKPILLQRGCDKTKNPWIREFEDLTVIGVNAESAEYLQIINEIQSPRLTIYSGCINWRENSHQPSILISHGVTWDHPIGNADTSCLKKNLNISDCLVSVDTNTISWFRSTYSKYINDNAIKMHYLPNYVDLEDYLPSLEDKNKRLKIIYPRRCSPERGFWLIADIIPELLTKFQNIEFEFVGFAHTDKIEAKIVELQKRFPYRLKHYVCNADEMPNVYKNADISIIPTLYSEGTSLSCIEAMASGNAVIATNIGGLPNLIINNYNGLLINPDKDSLFNALEALICDEDLRNKLKKNAIDVAKVFSKKTWDDGWNLILGKYLNGFESSLPLDNRISNTLKNKCVKNFLSNIDKKKKNRLFISTGFISSINAMSIILDLNKDNIDNHLIIYTSKTDDSFKDCSLKLILDGYFKQVYFADDLSVDENIEFVKADIFLQQFDEIYTTIQPNFKLYNTHKNITLFEEGLSAYIEFPEVDYTNVKKIYLSEYLNKLFYPNNEKEIVKIDKTDVKIVINKIINNNNFDFSYLEKENQVLILSQYIYLDILSLDEVILFYKKHIDNLLKSGYNVLFKSHPRVDDTVLPALEKIYKNNDHFNIIPIDIKYPIELMVEQINPIAIATSASGGAINCSHLFDIPCYGFGAEIAQRHKIKHIKKNASVFLNLLPHISQIYARRSRINEQ